MCYKMERFERMAEEKLEAQEVGLETEPLHIRIEVEGRGIDIDVIARDPNDCVMLAGAINYFLSCMDIEPKTVILP